MYAYKTLNVDNTFIIWYFINVKDTLQRDQSYCICWGIHSRTEDAWKSWRKCYRKHFQMLCDSHAYELLLMINDWIDCEPHMKLWNVTKTEKVIPYGVDFKSFPIFEYATRFLFDRWTNSYLEKLENISMISTVITKQNW